MAQVQEEDDGASAPDPVPEQYALAAVTALVIIGSIVALVVWLRM